MPIYMGTTKNKTVLARVFGKELRFKCHYARSEAIALSFRNDIMWRLPWHSVPHMYVNQKGEWSAMKPTFSGISQP